jgi:hypothetical protein
VSNENEELEFLDLTDLPTGVRKPLEDFLQHRAQMRGNRYCTRFVLSKLAIAGVEQMDNRHWRTSSDSSGGIAPVPSTDGHCC